MNRPETRFGSSCDIRYPIALWVAFLAGVLAGSPAQAQLAAPGLADSIEAAEPEEPRVEPNHDAPLPVDEKLKRFDISSILRAGRFANAQEQQSFDKFYNSYFLARWTEPKYFTSLPRYRQDLRNHFRLAKSGDVFNHLNALTLDFMGKLAAANRPPVVRVNALLQIGELNRVEQSGSQPPVPLPEALTVLLAAAENAKLPDGLRAAALVGVVRHAPSVSDDDARRTLSAAMLRLAASEPAPASTVAGHGWIVAQAIDVLGLLGSVGENNVVFNAMLKAVADAKLPPFARIAAANALGRLNYSSATGLNAVEAALALEPLAAEGCAEALRSAKTADDKSIERRRIMPYLGAVLTALGGEDANHKGILSLAKEPAQQAFLAELQKIVKDANDTLDDQRKEKEKDDMKPTVEGLQKSLDAWLKKKPK